MSMKDNPMLKDIRIGRKYLKHLNRQGLISPPYKGLHKSIKTNNPIEKWKLYVNR